MSSHIKTIEELKETLKQLLPMKLEYQQRLDEKIRLEFNFNSNHLEGNTLTYGETRLLLIFDQTSGNHEMREYEEMKAHDVAFELIKEMAADKERPLLETTIKEVHEILLVRPFWKEAITEDGQSTRRLIKVGDYKEFPNSVRLQNGEIFHYASPQETPAKMGDLIQWYREEEAKKELHPVELAAELHYRFVCIHPFDDGNGRMSRLLMNYVLLRHGLPPVIIKSAEKRDYLFALNQADTGNLGAFFDYISKELEWSLELTIRAAKGQEINEPDEWKKKLTLLKKGIDQNTLYESQSREALHRLGNDFIIPLITLILKETKEIDSLFAGRLCYINSDNKSIDFTDAESLKELFSLDMERLFYKFEFAYSLQGYKHDSVNTFQVSTGIEWLFEAHRFSMSTQNFDDKKYYLYTHQFTSDDLEEIKNKVCDSLVKQIEAQSSKKI